MDNELLTPEDDERKIAYYENLYGISSDEFLQRMRDETIEDSFETMDWMILLRHRDTNGQ